MAELNQEIARRTGTTPERVQAAYERRKELRDLPYVAHRAGEREAVEWACGFVAGDPVQKIEQGSRTIPEGSPATFRYDDPAPPIQTEDGWINPAYEAWDRQRRPELYAGFPTVNELRQELGEVQCRELPAPPPTTDAATIIAHRSGRGRRGR